MARNTAEAWIPEEYGSDVISAVNQTSVVERVATRVNMGTDTRHAPRSGGATSGIVAKGSAYPEATNPNDEVLLYATKFGTVVRLADEDVKDIPADIIAQKQLDWAKSYAVQLDNAALGTTAAGVANTTCPFNSVYYAVTQADATLGYTAGANLTQTTAATAATYDQFSQALGKVEGSKFYSPDDTAVIAHPSMLAALRGMKDGQQRPLFLDSPTVGAPKTFMGLPLYLSLGARTNATASDSPTGNPLIIFGNPKLLILGVRSGPEFKIAGADDGAGFLTDEALLKCRSRRAFAVGAASAFAVVEQR